VEPFVQHWQSVHGRSCKSDRARAKLARETRNAVRQMLELALHGSVEPHRPHKPPFEAEVPGFAGYLRDERGLKLSTIQHYVHYLNGLRRFIERADASVTSLSPELLAAFIVGHCAGLGARLTELGRNAYSSAFRSHTGRWEPLPGTGDLATVADLVVSLLDPYFGPNN